MVRSEREVLEIQKILLKLDRYPQTLVARILHSMVRSLEIYIGP